MKLTALKLIRCAGLSAMVAGILFVVIQPIHPPDTLASVTTGAWAMHYLTLAMSIFGLFGTVGLYARQVDKAGWLGLAGFLLFSLFWVATSAWAFAEVSILPLLATEAPKFVEGFLGLFSTHASQVSLGILPVLWAQTGILFYLIGGLLFGVATFRAGILPRWAGGLLAFGTVLPLLASKLVLHPYDRIFAVPVGLAVAWLGYALWSERREHAAEPVRGLRSPQLSQTGAD
jgi:hypothetical protein